MERKVHYRIHKCPLQVVPCHHGMAGSQVTVGGTASNIEGSYEYFERKQSLTAVRIFWKKAIADSRQVMVFQFGVCARC